MFLRSLDQHVSCSSIQLLVGWGSWQRLCTLCTVVTTTPAEGHFKSTRCRWSPHPTFCASKECSIKAHLLECKSTTFSAWILYISSSFKELSPFISSDSQWHDHPTSIPFCLWSNVTAVQCTGGSPAETQAWHFSQFVSAFVTANTSSHGSGRWLSSPGRFNRAQDRANVSTATRKQGITSKPADFLHPQRAIKGTVCHS